MKAMIVLSYACGLLGVLVVGFALIMAQQDPTQRNMRTASVIVLISVVTLLNFSNAVVRHRRYLSTRRNGKGGGV